MAVGGWNRMRVNVSEAEGRKKKVTIQFGLFSKPIKAPENQWRHNQECRWEPWGRTEDGTLWTLPSSATPQVTNTHLAQGSGLFCHRYYSRTTWEVRCEDVSIPYQNFYHQCQLNANIFLMPELKTIALFLENNYIEENSTRGKDQFYMPKFHH